MTELRSIDEMLISAVRLRDSNKLSEAIEKLHEIIFVFADHPKIAGVYIALADVYESINDFQNSRKYFLKASEANPKSELASLCLYLSLVKKGDYELAVKELIRQLESDPKNLREDTLHDIGNGYAVKRMMRWWFSSIKRPIL